MDRRIQKTRQLIVHTFIDLLTEKGFNKITINAIADRANINRGTVYLHYVDKFDLLDKCIETYVEPLLQYCTNTSSTTNAIVLQRMFEYLEKHFTIFKLFLSNETVGLFRNRIYTTIAQALTLVNAPKPENNTFSSGAAIHFFTSGFVGVLEWWINNSMPCTVDEITDQLLFLIEPYAKNLVSSSIVSRSSACSFEYSVISTDVGDV